MWIILLQRYWSQLLLSLLCGLFYILWMMTVSNLKDVKSEREQYKQALEFQNASLLQQKKEYDEKLSKLPTEIEKITVRYKVVYQDIDDWKGDENATDCENAGNYLRSFNY